MRGEGIWKETGQSCKLSIQNHDKARKYLHDTLATKRRNHKSMVHSWSSGAKHAPGEKTESKKEKKGKNKSKEAEEAMWRLWIWQSKGISHRINVLMIYFLAVFLFSVFCENSPLGNQDLDQILAELETPGSKKKAKKGKNWRHDLDASTPLSCKVQDKGKDKGRIIRIKARIKVK